MLPMVQKRASFQEPFGNIVSRQNVEVESQYRDKAAATRQKYQKKLLSNLSNYRKSQDFTNQVSNFPKISSKSNLMQNIPNQNTDDLEGREQSLGHSPQQNSGKPILTDLPIPVVPTQIITELNRLISNTNLPTPQHKTLKARNLPAQSSHNNNYYESLQSPSQHQQSEHALKGRENES